MPSVLMLEASAYWAIYWDEPLEGLPAGAEPLEGSRPSFRRLWEVSSPFPTKRMLTLVGRVEGGSAWLDAAGAHQEGMSVERVSFEATHAARKRQLIVRTPDGLLEALLVVCYDRLDVLPLEGA